MFIRSCKDLGALSALQSLADAVSTLLHDTSACQPGLAHFEIRAGPAQKRAEVDGGDGKALAGFGSSGLRFVSSSV